MDLGSRFFGASKEKHTKQQIPDADVPLYRTFASNVEEQRAMLTSAGERNDKLAIFIHGFWGNYLTTWGEIPHLLWTKAESDPILKSWDYLFIGYTTSNINSYLDIADRICTEWRHCTQGLKPFANKYSRVALFGHSLGTLGIRQFLCATAKHDQSISTNLHNVTLFGTPLVGCNLARTVKLGYPIAQALTPRNAQLKMLRVWTEGTYKHNPWPSVRLISGQGDWVVGNDNHDLAPWPGDGPPDIVNLDHIDLTKPTDWDDSATMNAIRNALHD